MVEVTTTDLFENKYDSHHASWFFVRAGSDGTGISAFKDVDPLPYLTDSQIVGFSVGVPILIIILGSFFTFCGQRVARSLSFTLGSLLFGGLSYLLMSDQFPVNYNLYIVIPTSFAFAILGGLLFQITIFVIIFLLGAFPALIVSIVLLNLLTGSSTVGELSEFLWCFTFVFFGGISALVVQKYLLIFTTSLCGALMMTSAIDSLWTKINYFTTFMDVFGNLFNNKYPVLVIADSNRSSFWILFAVMITTFIMGGLIQLKFGSTSLPSISRPIKKVQDKGVDIY